MVKTNIQLEGQKTTLTDNEMRKRKKSPLILFNDGSDSKSPQISKFLISGF